MTLVYSATCINAQLTAVQTTIDSGGGNGNLRLLAQGNVISTLALARPCATVSGVVLTFSGMPLTDPSAAGTGTIDGARIEDSAGNTVISNFSVGIPLSTSDIIISNGLNSTLISSGQTVQVLSATITGN